VKIQAVFFWAVTPCSDVEGDPGEKRARTRTHTYI